MKFRSEKKDQTVEAVEVIKPYDLTSAVFKVVPQISEAEFARIAQAAAEGSFTEDELAKLEADRRRAASKRKAARISESTVEAASASAREQLILNVLRPFTLTGVRIRPGQKAGAKAAAATARSKGSERESAIHRRADHLLEANYDVRRISGVIAMREDLSRPQVLKYLRTHPGGHWKKKVKQT